MISNTGNRPFGIFLLAGIAEMIWIALKVGNWSPATSHGIKVTAVFDHIGGLTVRGPVTLAGAAIGGVASIGIDCNDCSARITL